MLGCLNFLWVLLCSLTTLNFQRANGLAEVSMAHLSVPNPMFLLVTTETTFLRPHPN